MTETMPEGPSPAALRIGVYLDQGYWRRGDGAVAERSFVLFVNRLARSFARVSLLGRIAAPPARGDYRVDDLIDFVALPGYRSGAGAGGVARALPGSVRRLWHELGRMDVLWLLGPSATAVVFAVVAAMRRTPVVLGVRQDLRRYARTRHPHRRSVHIAADVLELAFRGLARRRRVVVVGSELARLYGRARSVLDVTISLVDESDVVSLEQASRRSYAGDPLTMLVVSRLDSEKNPLLLADVLARLARSDARWRMLVCGDGPMRAALHARLGELGIADRADLRGHVALDGELRELYRTSHALLHVSWTEGVPQVLYEAFAAGLPVVATDVGGVAAAAGQAAVLIPAGDAAAAAAALERVAADEGLRAGMIADGLRRAERHTIEHEAAAVAAFIAGAAPAARERGTGD